MLSVLQKNTSFESVVAQGRETQIQKFKFFIREIPAKF